VALLLQISDQEFGDGWVIINEEELDGIAGKDFHWLALSIITIITISTNLANREN
jgi:hypothetical protein